MVDDGIDLPEPCFGTPDCLLLQGIMGKLGMLEDNHAGIGTSRFLDDAELANGARGLGVVVLVGYVATWGCRINDDQDGLYLRCNLLHVGVAFRSPLGQVEMLDMEGLLNGFEGRLVKAAPYPAKVLLEIRTAVFFIEVKNGAVERWHAEEWDVRGNTHAERILQERLADPRFSRNDNHLPLVEQALNNVCGFGIGPHKDGAKIEWFHGISFSMVAPYAANMI